MTKRKMQLFAGILLCAVVGASSNFATAQRRKKNDKAAAPSATTSAADSAKNTAKKDSGATKLKKYDEVITKEMQTSKGFITVHNKDDKYFFEIPLSLMGRNIMAVNRVAKASADMRNGSFGLAGDEIGEAVYSFEKGPSNKLFLKKLSFTEYASDSTKTMFQGVQKNNVQPLAAAFPILAYSKDSSAIVVDVTELLNGDNDILYFSTPKFKERAGMGSQLNDRSYLKYVHTYATNLEVRAFKTYSKGLNPTNAYYSVELNSSLVLLPEKPMQGRLRDPRVGYFMTGYKDFDANPQGVKETIYAIRWRLEPKPEDVEKYKRGELVEPVKPIVFYIDPTTPKKWIPYLIAGVNDWQKSFEKAGFKNAIYAREAPSAAEDSTWSLDDATHSAIVYRPSSIANAMGPSVADPRSGEIIESHIFWYHNVMKLLHDWYLVQCGAVDPRVRKVTFDEDLMGQLIRFVSSHEVGHTLGLMHNFGASFSVPVDSLRNKKWVEAHGHTPSIMDYARFNYVAQPEDSISPAGLYPRINDYDNWAIQWGYTWHPEYKTPEEEEIALTKIVTDSVKNPRLVWGYEALPFDPRSQNEDLGNNAMKAGDYGVKNLKRILPNLAAWSTIPQDEADDVKQQYSAAINQFMLYITHVVKNIGGVYTNITIGAAPAPREVPVPKATQKEALAWVNKQVFTTPMWLNERSITSRFTFNFPIELNNLQGEVVRRLISRTILSHMLLQEVSEGRKGYKVTEYVSDMTHMIFAETYAGKNVDVYRRSLQKLYLERLLDVGFHSDNVIMNGDDVFPLASSDYKPILKEELKKIQQLARQKLSAGGLDEMTKFHLREVDDRIARAFAIK